MVRQNRTRRRAMDELVDSEGSWAISYGDMVTLLLAFFIIFFTADKYQQKTKNSPNVEMAFIDQIQKKAAQSEQAKGEDGSLPKEEIASKFNAKIYQIGHRILVEFPGLTFFKSGEVEINHLARETLNNFYSNFSPYMGHFQVGIRAFTDTRKVLQKKGRRFRDNLELSALRSISVMRHLEKLGVPLASMKLSGYGELMKTIKDLESIPESIRKPSSINDMERTVMLVIEPKEVQ